MCYSIETVLWDLLVIVAVVLLVLWILSLTGVILVNTGPVIHVFIALAILFAIVWLFVRFCYKRPVGSRRQGIV